MVLRERTYPADIDLDLWSRVRVACLCGGALLVLSGLAEDPAWVEQHFVDGFGATLSGWMGWVTAPLPFALAEVLFVGFVLLELLRLLETLAKVLGGRRRVVNALLGGLLHVVDAALFLGLFFQVTFGLAYLRPPAAERFQLTAATNTAELPVAQLRALVARASRETNQAYKALHGKDDADEVTVPRAGLDVDLALERGFATVGATWGLPRSFSEARGAAKEPWLSGGLSWVGIAGIYVPFTGEPLVNGGPPAWSRIHTRAHEKAHQRLVAGEDEASFVGFLACVASEDPLLRYAGWQFARRTLQSALVQVDPEASAFVAGKIDPGPQRDVIALHEWWARYEGPASTMGEVVNDAYLKSQGVEDGVRAYGRAATLVAGWMQDARGAREPAP